MEIPHLTCNTSHHKLMIKTGTITAKFTAGQQLLNATQQFLHRQAEDVLTGARPLNGCKCTMCSLQLSSL